MSKRNIVPPNPDRATKPKHGDIVFPPWPIHVCEKCKKYNAGELTMEQAETHPEWVCQCSDKTQPDPKRYSLEGRLRDDNADQVIFQTDNFRDVIVMYEEKKGLLDFSVHPTFPYDIIILYVWGGDAGLKEYVPIVGASAETSIKEW